MSPLLCCSRPCEYVQPPVWGALNELRGYIPQGKEIRAALRLVNLSLPVQKITHENPQTMPTELTTSPEGSNHTSRVAIYYLLYTH